MKRKLTYFPEQTLAGVRYRLSPPTQKVAIATRELQAFFEHFHEKPGYNVIQFDPAQKGRRK